LDARHDRVDKSSNEVDTTDEVSFVRWWWEKRGPIVQDSPCYIHAVRAWREAFRPRRVRVLLVAESHVAQAPEDERVRVSVSEDLLANIRKECALSHPLVLPDRFVRLVYCVGYGCNSVCTPRPPKNRGTKDFWEIFDKLAAGHRFLTNGTPDIVSHRIRVLEALRDFGIWLMDASVVAFYHSGGKISLFNAKMHRQIVRASFESFVWPAVKDDKPDQVWIIGKTIGKALQGCEGTSSAKIIHAPTWGTHRDAYEKDLEVLLRCVRQLLGVPQPAP
jgi:hypothetical protein